MSRQIINKHKIGWPEIDNLTPAQYRINQLIGKLDDAYVSYEKLWGVGVLPTIVDKELYDKWQRQVEKLNQAIEDSDLASVEPLIDGTIRGLALLDAKAREGGHKPHDAPVAWTCAMPSGKTLVIVGTHQEAAIWQAKATPDDRYAIWTIQEVANIIDSDHTLVNVLRNKELVQNKSELKSVPFDFEKGDSLEF